MLNQGLQVASAGVLGLLQTSNVAVNVYDGEPSRCPCGQLGLLPLAFGR